MAKSSIVCVAILLKSLLLLASCNGDCQSALQAVTSSISVNNNRTTTADTVVHQSPVKNGEENIQNPKFCVQCLHIWVTCHRIGSDCLNSLLQPSALPQICISAHSSRLSSFSVLLQLFRVGCVCSLLNFLCYYYKPCMHAYIHNNN